MDNEVTYQDDIVLQLRRAAVWTMLSGQRHMLDQAADEIARLRLTDAEREAVNIAQNLLAGTAHGKSLGSLLERLG